MHCRQTTHSASWVVWRQCFWTKIPNFIEHLPQPDVAVVLDQACRVHAMWAFASAFRTCEEGTVVGKGRCASVLEAIRM